jgi:hypothetical protein
VVKSRPKSKRLPLTIGQPRGTILPDYLIIRNNLSTSSRIRIIRLSRGARSFTLVRIEPCSSFLSGRRFLPFGNEITSPRGKTLYSSPAPCRTGRSSERIISQIGTQMINRDITNLQTIEKNSVID